MDKDQGHSKANQAYQPKEVSAGGDAVDKDQERYSKVSQANQAEKVSADVHAVDKDQDLYKANEANQAEEASTRGHLTGN